MNIDLLQKPDKQGIRDAVHVAVVSLIAEAIGIVNPFLTKIYTKGELVWVFIYPNTITNMTHHWDHPEFPSDTGFGMSLEEANTVIENMADSLDIYTYEDQTKSQRLIEIADRYCKHQSGCWPDEYDGSVIPGSWENFWRAYSVVTGNPRPTENRVPFRCAC